MYKNLIALSCLGYMAGCAIGPDYVKPKIDAPSTLRYQDANQSTAKINDKWWENIGDDFLTKYVNQVLANNLDIKISDAQVSYMLSQFDVAESYLYPQLSGSGNVVRQKQSENANPSASKTVTNTYGANLAIASYELDFWGKIRRANESARAKLLSSKEANRSVKIALATNAVLTYAKLLASIEQTKAAKELLQCASERTQLAGFMHQHGVISDNELNDIQSNQLNIANQYLSYQKKTVEAQNQYNLLLGNMPTDVKIENSSNIYSLGLSVPKGVPSAILENRPDILMAEQELISANAQIGVAKAAYFPSISLTGAFGFQSQDMSNLFSANSKAWQFTPAVNLPIFSAGRISAEVDSAKFGEKQAVLNYKKTIITAFAEVDNALFGYKNAKESEENSAKNFALNTQNLQVAELKYKYGSISKPAKLIAQQTYLASKLSLLDAKINTITSSLNLIKSFGNGW